MNDHIRSQDVRREADQLDSLSAAVIAELFPPPPSGRTREDVRAEAEALLPEGVGEFDEVFESKGVRTPEGPWPRGLAAALVVRGISKGSKVTAEKGKVVIWHVDGTTSTLSPVSEP